MPHPTQDQLRAAYLDEWMRGLLSFAVASTEADEAFVDRLDGELAAADDVATDDRRSPLDRLGALGLTDGYTAARSCYSAAFRRHPWDQLHRPSVLGR